MAALVNSFRKLFKSATPPPVVGANSVLPPSEENIAASKTRICGLLDKKKEDAKIFDFAETRYYLQHCGKTQNDLPYGTLRVKENNTALSPVAKKLQTRYKAILQTPIDPMKYPMESTNTANNFVGGKRSHKKTQKRRRGRKGTRKH
jgi:hypothetical protein